MTKRRTLKSMLAVGAVVVALCLTLVGCGKCEHVYDNDCDTSCNECDEAREVSHNFVPADCDTPNTCTVCGATEGEAEGHTPMADDGDCTTAVTCEKCDYILTEAQAEHNFTEADCDTPKTCTVCGATEGEAKGHTPMADDGDCTTAVTCTECGHIVTEAQVEHSLDSELQCEICNAEVLAEVVIDGSTTYFYTRASMVEALAQTSEDAPASVKLYRDITVSNVLELDGYFTLDLNGKTIQSATEFDSYLLQLKAGSIRIVDGAGGGKIQGKRTVFIDEGATLTFESGSIIATQYYGIYMTENATLVVDDTAYIESGMYAISSSRGCVIHIKGGTLNGSVSLNYSSPKEVLISGGTMLGKLYDNTYGGSAVQPVITGGSFPEGMVIGTYVAPFMELLGEGYGYFVSGVEVTPETSAREILGSVTVQKHVHTYPDGVCLCGQVGGTYDEATNTYRVISAEWLMMAFDNSAKLGTEENPLKVVLESDVSIPRATYGRFYTDTALMMKGGVVVLDLNGNNLIMDIDELSTGISVENGSLTVTDTKGTGKIVSNADYMIYFTEASLTVNNGAYETTGMHAIFAFKGIRLDIKGGTFKSSARTIVTQNCETVITGGEFEFEFHFFTDVPASITGGTFNAPEFEFHSAPNGILGFDSETGVGACFSNGISVAYGTLADLLADGAAFFDANGNQITEGLDGNTITGPVYIKRIAK